MANTQMSERRPSTPLALLTIANQVAPKMKARLIIDPAARRMPELPVLVLLGWYLMVLTFEDSAAAGA